MLIQALYLVFPAFLTIIIFYFKTLNKKSTNSTLFQELAFKEKIKERERREKERQERGERRGDRGSEKGVVDAFRGSFNSTSNSGMSKEEEAELSNIMVGAAVF